MRLSCERSVAREHGQTVSWYRKIHYPVLEFEPTIRNFVIRCHKPKPATWGLKEPNLVTANIYITKIISRSRSFEVHLSFRTTGSAIPTRVSFIPNVDLLLNVIFSSTEAWRYISRCHCFLESVFPTWHIRRKTPTYTLKRPRGAAMDELANSPVG